MKIAAFVPVRLSSTRLPSKALRDLHGKPCLQRLIERIRRVKGMENIVICTTEKPSDDKIEEFARKMEIECFRGSEIDILERYKGAAGKFSVENIVNIDGDDVFCEPKFIEITASELLSKDVDFVMWKDMPLGSTPLGIKTEALKKVCDLKDTTNTETGWAKFFTDTGLFKVKYLTSDDSDLNNSNVRLTLDYPDDLKLFEKIYENLEEPFSLKDILKLIREKPELQKINSNLMNIYKKNFERKSAKVTMKKL